MNFLITFSNRLTLGEKCKSQRPCFVFLVDTLPHARLAQTTDGIGRLSTLLLINYLAR